MSVFLYSLTSLLPRWPDWANLSPNILGSYFEYYKATFSTVKAVTLILTKKYLGIDFGRFFHKLIRGRCYYHDFRQFSAKKWRFSQKPML
jgi:hypothetical protein